MKLIYNILCIDDNLTRLRKVKEDFIDINDIVGLGVNFQDIDASLIGNETVDEYKARMEAAISGQFSEDSPIYDLIWVDLHFGPKDEQRKEVFNGSDVIKVIRNHSLYRPIVFYSSGVPENYNASRDQLEDTIKNSDLFGTSVFMVPFNDLSIFLDGLAKDMHKEEHKLNQVRGLLMDQVSEFDGTIIDIISDQKIWDLVPATDRDKVLKEFRELIGVHSKKAADLLEVIKKLDFQQTSQYIATNRKEVQTFIKGKTLRRILEKIPKFQPNGIILSEGINPGPNSIVDIRNKYAHETADKLITGHDADKCKHIRVQLKRQLKNIEEVAKGS